MLSYCKVVVFFISLFSSHEAVANVEERITNGFSAGGPPPVITGAVYIKQEDINVASKTTYIGPLCAASSIAEDRGFSSAYCLYNAWEKVSLWNEVNSQRLKFPKSLRLIFGFVGPTVASLNNLINNFEATEMEITNQNIRYPTGFNYSGQHDLFPNDIAMIKFPRLLRYNNHANITNDTVVVGDTHPNLAASGFGSKSCSAGNLQVQIANVTIVECPPNITKWPEQFCVNISYNGTDSQESQGDWGGPVFQRTILEDGQISLIQFGVLSYQQKADPFGAGCTTAGQPQVATLVSSFYNDLIKEYQGVVIEPLKGPSESTLPPENLLETILTSDNNNQLTLISQLLKHRQGR